jgi:hypothetical protein
MSRVKVPFPVQCAAKLASLMSQKDHDTNLSTAVVCARVIVAIKHTANCIMMGHFSAFEPGLVAPFLYTA